VLVSLIAIEAIWRLVMNRPPGVWAGRLSSATVVVVLVAAAGGLGILVGGGAPGDSLHYVYALIAILGLPVTSTLVRRRAPRAAAGLVVVVALVLVVVLLRLFQTG
jgi:hypothetical protein